MSENNKQKRKIKSGIIQIVGEWDVGKTSMAIECGYKPEEIIFVDDDVKGKSTVRQMVDDGMEFAKYIDFTAMCKDQSVWGIYQQTIDVFEQVKMLVKNKNAKVLIWDTWERAGVSFVEYVRHFPQNFVEKIKNSYWTGSSAIITGTQYKYAALAEGAFLNELQRIVPLVFLISHLKTNYKNNVPCGVKAASSKALAKVPYLRVWLRRNPNSPVPTALIMKRLNRKIYDESVGAIRTINILPPKVVPNIVLPEEGNAVHNDRSVWDTIARYYEHPAGLRKLLPDEIPNEDENSILSGTMTDDQRTGWLAALKEKNLLEEEEAILAELNRDNKIKNMLKKKISMKQIAAECSCNVKYVLEVKRSLKNTNGDKK